VVLVGSKTAVPNPIGHRMKSDCNSRNRLLRLHLSTMARASDHACTVGRFVCTYMYKNLASSLEEAMFICVRN
jgi:hypothetical protein